MWEHEWHMNKLEQELHNFYFFTHVNYKTNSNNWFSVFLLNVTISIHTFHSIKLQWTIPVNLIHERPAQDTQHLESTIQLLAAHFFVTNSIKSTRRREERGKERKRHLKNISASSTVLYIIIVCPEKSAKEDVKILIHLWTLGYSNYLANNSM